MFYRNEKLLSYIITFMKKISCVMMVDYYHKYIKASLSINSIYNHIYLLGTSKYKSFENENITFVNIENYNTLEFTKKINDNFVNFGAKDDKSEIFWLSRIPRLKQFMNDFDLDSIFMIDSDNILLLMLTIIHSPKKMPCVFLKIGLRIIMLQVSIRHC